MTISFFGIKGELNQNILLCARLFLFVFCFLLTAKKFPFVVPKGSMRSTDPLHTLSMSLLVPVYSKATQK